MPSAEYAKRFEGYTRDTFHLTRETETDTLECIYTARIEAWMVDDGDLVSYVSFNNNKK